MAKTVSFVVLVVLVLLVGALFVAVMQQFLLPLFLALLQVIIFRPLHEWILAKMPSHRSIAAGLTTLAIVTIVLLPFTFVAMRAGTEAVEVAKSADPKALMDRFKQQGERLRDWSKKRLKVEIPSDEEIAHQATDAIKTYLAPVARWTTTFLFSLLFGMAIMLISMYFFFADGQEMVMAIIKFTPMDSQYVRHLFEQFGKVSRAVVSATLLSAVAQAVLAGIAYLVVGMPHLFLLTAMTGLMAMVPFVGATAIWLPCAAWLYFFAPYASPQAPDGIAYGRPGAAILLAVWGAVAIGMADNIIKPYVLRGQSNIHPLLALLSVIGGVQALGPIGIFVGPMVVAFLHALLTLLRGELSEFDVAKEPIAPVMSTGANSPAPAKD